jgi:CheY-like chemotaxis protein
MSYTLLLVEDNEANRDMLSRRLRKRGYTVEIAGDGVQALQLAALNGFNLILMDISLPEMDGLEATRRLRQSTATVQTPIIALTAHAQQSDREQALAAGCNDFDTKPVDFKRLLAKIESLLQPKSKEVMDRD